MVRSSYLCLHIAFFFQHERKRKLVLSRKLGLLTDSFFNLKVFHGVPHACTDAAAHACPRCFHTVHHIFFQLASHSSTPESPKKQLFLLLSPLPFFAKNNSSAWFISGFYYLLWFFLSVLLTLYSILPSHSLCCQPKGKQVKREGRQCITIAFTQDGPKGTFFLSVTDTILYRSSETCHSNHERRFLKLYRRWSYKSSSLKARFAQKDGVVVSVTFSSRSMEGPPAHCFLPKLPRQLPDKGRQPAPRKKTTVKESLWTISSSCSLFRLTGGSGRRRSTPYP